MRVLALGGGGGMGVHACNLIADLDHVTDLVVTDLSADHARSVAAGFGPRVRGVGLDVTDAIALSEAMAGADVVVNTVGPFFRFGVPILTAAINSGCHYIDICDDWEPISQMLALDGLAREAGVTALVGVGASPGITNLLAVLAARELESVEQIVTGWSLDAVPPASGPDGAPSAAIVHAIQQITGTISVTRGGQVVSERPLRSTKINYPGVGHKTARTFGHPEAVTLPRAFPGISSVNVAFGSRATTATLVSVGRAVDRGLLSARRAAVLIDRAERLVRSSFGGALRPGLLPPIFGLAIGRHAGGPASVGCALVQVPGTTMGEATGIPLGVALTLLPDADHGVHTPETALDPARFFAALAPYCLGAPDPASMVVLSRSWDPTSSQVLESALARLRTIVG